MNEEDIIQYITGAFKKVETVYANGDTFFFNDPQKKFPFATLVTTDYNDQFSNLSRPGVFRLNIGPSKTTFQSLFGTLPPSKAISYEPIPGYDYTVQDKIIPHPVYGRMYWVCVLNPSRETFETQVQPLLADAYDLSAGRYGKRTTHE
jgi:hypothetical protein